MTKIAGENFQQQIVGDVSEIGCMRYAALLAVLCLVGCGQSQSSDGGAPPGTASAQNVSAELLVDDFKDSAGNAAAEYVGKQWKVDGTFSRFEPGSAPTLYLSSEVGGQITCHMSNDADAQRLTGLDPAKDDVTVVGTVVNGGPDGVNLDDCSVYEVNKASR
jgi:hypothetical protein